MIVLHYTAMDGVAAALERLCAPEHEVSAHYLICGHGRIYSLVEEAKRAWHAGAGQWGNVTDVNSHSIGIELSNTGETPFSEPQMAALEHLLSDIMNRHRIAPERVIGHSDMAPGRKIDPGVRFDWQRLAWAGVSVWPDNPTGAAPDMPRFLQALECFGYAVNLPAETLLSAFRLRFRPHASGPLHPDDMAMASDLAQRFPVDRKQIST